MTGDSENAENERRWTALVEAEACGELSEAERAELDELTSRTEERKQERRLLAARTVPFDAHLDANDERVIDVVLAQHRQASRRRRKVIWLAAAALLVPLAAAAAYLPRLINAGGPSVPAVSSDLSTSPRKPPKPEEPAAKPGEEAEAEFPSAPAAPSVAPEPSKRAAVPIPSAGELLERAQRARSAQEYQAAITAYEEILRHHPKSTVAPLARISLAQLHLGQGNAAAALAGFEAYERSGGALSQEAHYGKIQALRALGRNTEERAEIARFLERYPNSLQASALKQRLDDGRDPK